MNTQIVRNKEEALPMVQLIGISSLARSEELTAFALRIGDIASAQLEPERESYLEFLVNESTD